MSFLYTILKPVVRPFARGPLEKAIADPASFMVRVKKMQEKPLPLKQLHRKHTFEEKKIGSTMCYQIHSRRSKGKKLVLYFFGGGYCLPGDSGDFEFGQDMADHIGRDVWLVWYPMFPDATGYSIAHSGAEVYREALKTYAAQDIAFYGNSSGAALCLSLCGFLRKYCPETPLPGKVAAHSPCVRIPTSAEEQARMNAQDKKDVMIPANYVNIYLEYPEIFKDGGYTEFASPIEQSWAGYPELLFLFGEDEVFLAYLPSIEKKCREDHVDYDVYVGKGCHCFSAAGFLPEAKPGRERIYRFLAESTRTEKITASAQSGAFSMPGVTRVFLFLKKGGEHYV